jgi:hypothetical protein
MKKRLTLSLLCALLGVLGLQATGRLAQGAENPDGATIAPERLGPALAAQKRHEAQLFALPGVMAVGTGVAEPGQAPTVDVFLNVQAPGAAAVALPQVLEGVGVRVWQTDQIRAFDGGANHRRDFPAPVPMGVSTGNDNGCFTGTLGFRVRRTGDASNVGYLTNNHVAAAGGANLCPNRAPLGEDQFQPGLFDNGCAVSPPSIGDLEQFVPIVFGGAANQVDAAYVRSTRSKVGKTILDIGNPSPTVLAPSVGQTVQKSGRTTGYTRGRVTTINATVQVSYGSSCGTARFTNQAIVTACCGFGQFSAAGDSGSPVLSLARDGANRFKPVGLLFAGSTSITVINPLATVLSRLGVQIDTQ